MSGGWDCDAVRLSSPKWRTARKSHPCESCRHGIRARDRYHYLRYVDGDGTPGHFRHCARCWMIVEAVGIATGEPVQTDLACGHNWHDTVGDLPDSVAALAFLTEDEIQTRLVAEGIKGRPEPSWSC